MVKVSVIIPTYNSENRIKKCLSAVLKQDFKDFETIVVDDGSTDSTAMGLKDFKVRVFSKKNGGPATARNFGAKKAIGKIIVFIDDDCVPQKNWLKEMVKPFEDKNVMGVQGAYKSVQKELCARFEQIEIEDRYDKIRRAKKMDWIGSYSAAYRKEVFFKKHGYDASFPTASGEDPELSYKLAKDGNLLVFNPNAIVFHTHNPSFFSYLKKKFFRAYWRVLLYKKHSDKIVNDSYTPQSLKIQIMLFYSLFIAPLVVLFFFPEKNMLFFAETLVLAFFFATTMPFALKALQKDFSVGLISPIVLFARSAMFGLGLIAGIFKGVWLR